MPLISRTILHSAPPPRKANSLPTRLLLLMRHAKSDWSSPAETDHERPLNRRGRRDCPAIARYLAARDRVPDVILCSSATRTTETANRLMETWSALGLECPKLCHHEELYLASAAGVVQAVASLGGQAERLMVMAHNPGISSLAATLAGEDWEMPTAAVATMGYPSNGWSTLKLQSDLDPIDFMRPKALPEEYRNDDDGGHPS